MFKSERQVRKSKETGTFSDFSVKRDARVALVIPQSFKAASIIGMVLDFFSQGFNDHVRGNEAL